MAVDSKNDVIRSGAECLQKAYHNNLPPSQEVHLENVKIENQLYYIDSFFLNLKRLPMVGVVMIPRKYIMGKVDEEAFKALMILISASVCILAVGCICIFILTNGVSKEMKLRAALISHLDARRKAEASSNCKSLFLANMSHDLRTPMAAVIGLLDILVGDDCLTNEQHGMVTQIRKCSTALLRLLNNILDLSKVESGKLILEETEFDLSRELEALVDMFSVQCINQRVEIVLDLSDDMPKAVLGDSGRILQIFANLISNSIKFTTSGYIILRGWCETADSDSKRMEHPLSRKESWCPQKAKWRQGQKWRIKSMEENNKVILWFEVNDTGCGIDPSKWESVFESFEQAVPSTTRLHGGTGLGLCIVRTLVNKMDGEIKVVKKDGPGTLIQLYVLLRTPTDCTRQKHHLGFKEQKLTVMLALNGRMTGLTMVQWLQSNGICTHRVSEWNELTVCLMDLVKDETHTQDSPYGCLHSQEPDVQCSIPSIFIIIVDIDLLDLHSEIWKQQLDFLDKYSCRFNFAWILTHDTSNVVKTQLHKRGHPLLVNGPLYKSKVIQIFESVIKDRYLLLEKDAVASRTPTADKQFHELFEMEELPYGFACSDDSGKLENERFRTVRLSLPEKESNGEHVTSVIQLKVKDQSSTKPCPDGQLNVVDDRKSLEGLCILLAEDTPILQRVAKIMLEKMGAKVVIVGDGLGAVQALTEAVQPPEHGEETILDLEHARLKTSHTPFDLILMDCQMPKMDGYEATKAIRRMELGSGVRIPIVALTAHAMSSDEAKCLEAGMDAYLTKPIDWKLMISTILSLTQGTV